MDIIQGLQWGDEGKGKIVDFMAPQYDMVTRFQGGPNAGHTLTFGGNKYVLHQIPSGIFQPTTQNLIGNGVVLDVVILRKEIEKLQDRGFEVVSNLYISKKAHLILPTHRLLDAAQEKSKGDRKIGSTLRGIGPTYQDKIGRTGLRVGDLLLPDFDQRYRALTEKHCQTLGHLGFEYDLAPLEADFMAAVDFIRQLQLVEGEYFVNQALNQGKKVLAEGAQGTLLDIDFGSYPFVTSSNTFSAGACTGLGVAPNRLKGVLGIFKAYCTRVGSGPFPTELHDEEGEELRKIGNEFGATTGRPRRCGWLDLPALKYAVMLNGNTELFMMKADVLCEFPTLKVCTHYKLKNGQITDQFPYNVEIEQPEPVYTTVPGWQTTLEGLESFDQMPKPLQNYISLIEQAVGVPVTLLSYGPDRTQTLLKNKLGAGSFPLNL